MSKKTTTAKTLTPFQRAQYEDENKPSEATLAKRELWMDFLGSGLDHVDKLVMIYLMSFGGTTRTLIETANLLGVGVGDVDRAFARLTARGYLTRPNPDCAGINVNEHRDLGKLLEPLVDRSKRGVHLRKAGARPELAGLSPNQRRRRQEIQGIESKAQTGSAFITA